jgi:hypothetical protein
MNASDHDPLNPHSHDPNPAPPSASPNFSLILPDGRKQPVDAASLRTLPRKTVSDCYIVSTGHGTSGPFTFEGVLLLDLIEHNLDEGTGWSQVEIASEDGFGTRIDRKEVENPQPGEHILLADTRDGKALSRQEGLVRLIVPGERDDALRQVKWVDVVRLVSR